MIKVTTHSNTVYIIDTDNKRIKRIPSQGTTFESILRGFINVGEFQPYTSFEGLEIDNSLRVTYPGEQHWSRSTPITSIEYDFKEE